MKRFGTASTVFNLMLSDPATKPRVEVKEVTMLLLIPVTDVDGMPRT